MKTIQFFLRAVMLSFVAITLINAQGASVEDSTGLPGDNFSLQGALEMFKQAGSPEEFEKLINTEDNNVNNIDLNGDGDIDYIRVVGKMDKEVHAFALQVPVSETENQDIAVIELEKTGEAAAMLQIIGDEDIYGERTIVEPDGGGDDDEEADDNGDGGGPRNNDNSHDGYYAPRIVVNVWLWPSVRFVYGPSYTVWVSPWKWRVYPVWWRPWRPLAWRVFHPFRLRYRSGFAVVRTHRVVHAHTLYAPARTTSATVRTRHHASVTHYRVTKSTTIKAKSGGTKVKATRKTTRGGKKRR